MNISGIPGLEEPKPASSFIPDWYKDTFSYLHNKKKPIMGVKHTATIKRCMPVFDALTAGYIIVSPADVWVEIKDNQQWFQWTVIDPLITFHGVEQAPLHPLRNQHAFAKWENPWAVRTPKGYSTLYVQPFHRESLFTVFPGIVDTDTYGAATNFPFVMNDPNFEGLIPAGTPIVQAIPIKRDSWKMKISSKDYAQENKNFITKVHTKFFDGYKTMFWSKKEYR